VNIPPILFGAYFFVGIILIVVALATRGKERRAAFLDFSSGSIVDAGLLIFKSAVVAAVADCVARKG
jgi:hypothetical protein